MPKLLKGQCLNLDVDSYNDFVDNDVVYGNHTEADFHYIHQNNVCAR